MALSGTYAFNPPASDLVLNALSRNQITGSQITTDHLSRAATEANLAMVRYGNLQPNWWKSELTSVSLVSGTATYTLDASVVDIIIIYLSVTSGGVTTDRVLGPISTVEYNSFPQKDIAGTPTSFYFNRQITPQVTFWPVPDDNSTFVAKIQILRQFQDTSLKSGLNADLPWRWLDAYSWEITARMAAHFKPEFFEKWDAIATRSWSEAASEDSENVNIYVTPGMSGYYR
jgi:hypothetical protein